MFLAVSDFKKTARNCQNHPSSCEVEPLPFQNKNGRCQGMWYCDAVVDVGIIEVLFRQTNFLIRNLKRELAKGAHLALYGTGKNPSGKNLIPLEDAA